MEEPMRIQLAWKFIELLVTLADFILEQYIDDPNHADLMDDSNDEDHSTQ